MERKDALPNEVPGKEEGTWEKEGERIDCHREI